MQGTVAVVVFCCVLVVVVQVLERHQLRAGRPHRILRLHPVLGVPGGAAVVIAVPPALAALGVTELSTPGGIVLGCVVVVATGWASVAHRRWKATL